MRRFTTKLAPLDAKWNSGYAGGANMDVDALADEVFGARVPGEWLTCYMIRRFGWPNAGSDEYKNLCTWMLVTPIAGLFLTVTPYLGGGPVVMPEKYGFGNLHFGVRFTTAVGSKIDHEPGRQAFFRRRERAVRRWWDTEGCELYILGTGLVEGDDHELVKRAEGEKDGKVWGVWRRKPEDKRQRFGKGKVDGMLLWWISEFIIEKHPEAGIPAKMSPAERRHCSSAFARRATAAIKRTMLDLFRPTRVRDVWFGAFGLTERGEAPSKGPDAPWFDGAGYAAEYWFTTHRRRQRAAARKAAKEQ